MTTTEVSLENVQCKVSLKDVLDMMIVKNVTRKCKNKKCGALVPLVNATMGQKVCCPECGKPYIIKKEIKFEIVIDPVEV
jgi:hypothetical protein